MITPEQLCQNNTEDGHQLALFCWITFNKTTYPDLMRLFHIPNGGSRHKAEAAKLKGMGVKSGVPDLMLPIPRGKYHGLFLELKKARGVHGQRAGIVSKEQNDWIDFLRTKMYGAVVCHGWEEARDMLIKYLEWK